MVTVHHRHETGGAATEILPREKCPFSTMQLRKGQSWRPRRGGCKGRSAMPSAFESTFSHGLVCGRDFLPGS